MPQSAADRGFTLVEILVAFVIFASVTVAIQQSHMTGIKGVRTAQHDLAALAIARSLLAGAGSIRTLQPGLDEWGTEGTYRWHMTASRYVPPAGTPPLAPQLEGFWTTVTVSWTPPDQAARSVALETLKLQAATP